MDTALSKFLPDAPSSIEDEKRPTNSAHLPPSPEVPLPEAPDAKTRPESELDPKESQELASLMGDSRGLAIEEKKGVRAVQPLLSGASLPHEHRQKDVILSFFHWLLTLLEMDH
jgi:hypothetical protein